MSEQAPEQAPRQSSGGNAFTRKLGPLPLWGWMGVGLAIALAYYFYKQKKSSSSSSSGSNAGSSTAGSSTTSSLIPQFVNQVYNQETPPPAPNVQVQAPTDQDTTPPDTDEEDKDKTPKPPSKNPPPKGKTPQPPIFNGTYVVKAGDTLNSVAAKFHISRVSLAHANGYGTGAGLRTGEKLKVPSPAPGGRPNKAP